MRNTDMIDFIIQCLLMISISVLLPVMNLTARAVDMRPLRTFILKDYINHKWANELIHYDMTFKPGECWQNSLRLTDESGNLLPIQFTDIKTHKDGSIASATLWFILGELPANGMRIIKLTGGDKNDTIINYTSDLSLVKEDGSAVISTSKIGVRALLDEKKFEKPQPIDKIPAPLQGVRLADNLWIGKGWFETRHLCTGYSAKLTNDGSVFKKVVIHYDFVKPKDWTRDKSPFYEMTVQVTAGQEIAYVTEDYNLGDPQIYQEPKYKDEKHELIWDWWSSRPHESTDNFCFSFLAGGNFKPTKARTLGHNVSSPDKGTNTGNATENEYKLQFDVDRFEFSISPWAGWLTDQSSYYTVFNADDPNSDILSIVPTMAGKWRNPDMLPHEPNFIAQHTDTTAIRVYSAKNDLFMRAPLNLGHREWMVVSLKNPNIVTDETRYTIIAELSRKYGSLPLDKVKDWVLEWDTKQKYPHLYIDAGDLEGLRKRIKSMTAVEDLLRKESHIPCYRWLLDGKDEDFDKACEEMLARLDENIHETLSGPYGGERVGINAFPWWMQDYSAKMDVLLGNPKIDSEMKHKLLSRMAFLTYFLRDGEYFPPRKAGFGWGSANMPVNTNGARALTASLISDHPMGKAWIEYSAKVFNYIIQQYYNDDGSPYSCPHYQSTTTGPVTTVVLAMQRTGLIGDVKQAFPNLYQYGRYQVDQTVPKDIRFGQRINPTQGDTYWEGNAIPGQIAGLYRDSDPQLAGELMSVWLESGTSLAGYMNGAFYFDPTILPKKPNFISAVHPGYGAFLRSAVGTDQESYISILFGTFTIDHMHNDAGSFHWYARGVPLSLDWASMYTPIVPQNWWHSTLSYNHEEHEQPIQCPGRGKPGCFYTGKSWYEHAIEPHTSLAPIADMSAESILDVHGKITAFSTQQEADYVCGEANRHWFEKSPYYYRNEGSPSPWAAQESKFEKIAIKQPFKWIRQFAFVKDENPDGPAYLVISDDLSGNQELEPAFNFWCLANDVKEVSNRQYYFTGQHGVDLDMFVSQPDEGRIQPGEWGHHQGFLVGGDGMDENQKFVRIYGKPDGKGFHVVLYPRKVNEPQPKVEVLADGKLTKLTLPDQTHWILLSKEPITVTDGSVKMTGTAGVIKKWNDGKVRIILLAEGKAEYGNLKAESKKPVTKEGIVK